MTYFIRIYKSGQVGEIILGYEPAEDEDMKMIEISKDKITIFNESVFESSVATMVYGITSLTCTHFDPNYYGQFREICLISHRANKLRHWQSGTIFASRASNLAHRPLRCVTGVRKQPGDSE